MFPITFQFSKNSPFQRNGAKNWFFNLQCFKFNFETFLVLGLLKHYKIGVSAFFVLFVVEREEIGKKMITGISGFCFFGPKMAVS